MVLCDERMLEQILYNLMGNAFSYTGEDKKVSVRVEKTDGGVKVSVTDTGRGIDPSEKDKVWDRYYRASQTKRAVMGSGIGLSIVKQLFEVNNAQYGIDSVVNRGSTFWFILPSPPEQTARTDRFRQAKDRPNGENVESKPKRGKKREKRAISLRSRAKTYRSPPQNNRPTRAAILRKQGKVARFSRRSSAVSPKGKYRG